MLTSLELQTLNSIENISALNEFMDKADSIENAVVAKCIMRRDVLDLRRDLAAMRNRITLDIASKHSFESRAMLESMESGNQAKAFEELGKLIGQYNAPPAEFTRRMNYLLRISGGALRSVYSIKDVNTVRYRLAEKVEDIPIFGLEDVEPEQCNAKFECPISYEDEADPCILVVVPSTPLAETLNKQRMDLISNNPLNALSLDDFMTLFIKHIDHAISLKSLRSAEEMGMPITTSPLTRRKVIGAITLGATDSHCRAANFTIARLISGGRKYGHPDFWIAYLWILVKQNKIPYLNEIEPFIRDNLIYRMRNSMHPASLTWNADYPQTNIPMECAIFTCIASFVFMSENKSVEKVARMIARLHAQHAASMIELLELCGVRVPGVEQSIKMTKALTALNDIAKQHRGTYKYLFQSLVQRSELVSLPEDSVLIKTFGEASFRIPIDGAPKDDDVEAVLSLMPPDVRELDTHVLFWLSQFVNPNLPLSDILFEGDPPSEVPPRTEWPHYLNTEDKFPISICPATMRPYTMVKGMPFRQKLEAVIGQRPQNDIISCSLLFGELVSRLGGKYPTSDELLAYLFNRTVMNGTHSTLPVPSRSFCEETINDFGYIMRTISPRKFRSIFHISAPLAKRIELEENYSSIQFR